MRIGLWDYIRAAFHVRPIGMWISPNVAGLAAFGLLGLLNPGFWLIGMGLELAYLYAMTSNDRFRRYVEATTAGKSQQQWQDKLLRQRSQLSEEDQAGYRALEERCQAILHQQGGSDNPAGVAAQAQGLSRLLWMYLRLLLMRQSIHNVLSESTGRKAGRLPLEERIARLTNQMQGEKCPEELHKSLSRQIEILQQRLEGQSQGKQKLVFLEAELTRIEEQVELIREQAVLASDPQAVSQRIDQVTATLGETMQWIGEQQKVYGQVEDLLVEPPILNPPCQSEGQSQ